MSQSSAVRLPRELPTVGLLLALLALVLVGVASLRAPRIAAEVPPGFDALLPWQAGAQRWLLVADGRADQLIVYDAVSGRRLRRVEVKRGLRDVDSLGQRDGHLFVVDEQGRLDELALPSLQQVATSGR